jgi:hypothetical protein
MEGADKAGRAAGAAGANREFVEASQSAAIVKTGSIASTKSAMQLTTYRTLAD